MQMAHDQDAIGWQRFMEGMTCTHVLFCHHTGWVETLQHTIDLMEDWLEAVGTDPDLLNCIAVEMDRDLSRKHVGPLALARLYGESWIFFTVNFVWYSLGIVCLAIFIRRKNLLLISAIFSAIFSMRGNINS